MSLWVNAMPTADLSLNFFGRESFNTLTSVTDHLLISSFVLVTGLFGLYDTILQLMIHEIN